jgi:D-alanine-D-alanine ligase
MSKKLSISIIYNDPVQYAKGPTYDGVDLNTVAESIDMSEYGVLDEVRSVQKALKPLKFDTSLFPVALDIYKLIDYLKASPPGIIFNLCESVDGDPTQEMNIAGLFELLGIPYTGCRAFTLGLALNKPLVKQILNCNGIPTARYFIAHTSSRIYLNGHKFPMIVKPMREDASIGISNESVVTNREDLKRRVEFVLDEHYQPALIEEYIEGRELNVSVVGNEEPVTFPVSEIDFSDLPVEYPKIVSYNSKWMSKTVEYECTKAVCPAEDLTKSEIDNIQETAKRVYRLLGACDYARVDMRFKNGIPYVLELNPNPDISSDVPEDTGFTRSAKAHGWDYDFLIQQIINFALKRWNIM